MHDNFILRFDSARRRSEHVFADTRATAGAAPGRTAADGPLAGCAANDLAPRRPDASATDDDQSTIKSWDATNGAGDASDGARYAPDGSGNASDGPRDASDGDKRASDGVSSNGVSSYTNVSRDASDAEYEPGHVHPTQSTADCDEPTKGHSA